MIGDGHGGLPAYDALPRDDAGAPVGWGVFGPGDAVGRMNLQSTGAVAAAARSVERGAVFPLNAPHDLFTPPLFGRGRIRHTRLPVAGGAAFDDVYDNYYPQASSQWDALAHEAYRPDAFYQGVSAAEIARGERNGIEAWAQRGIAGRGVLLDVSRTLAAAGRPLDPGSSTPLTVADLELTRSEAGIEFRPGDVVLIRTGFVEWYQRQDQTARIAMSRPGGLTAAGIEHTEAMARYVWDSGAAAFASDAPGLEVWPPDPRPEAAPFGYLHRVLIGQFGLAVGELWWLADLADDCAADGRYDFLFCSAPVNVPGGIGSPANAVAIK
ncbi:cyclase family protein [Blastococcus sp. SYSU DS0539]